MNPASDFERETLGIRRLHHVAVPVTDLARAKKFYGGLLGLREVPRPPFDFAGAWYQLGDGQLHLIVHGAASFRAGKGIDSRDVHFAVRVGSYTHALERLRTAGYREDAEPTDPMRMRANANPTAGFPQIFILDPDRNVIELNAEAADGRVP